MPSLKLSQHSILQFFAKVQKVEVFQPPNICKAQGKRVLRVQDHGSDGSAYLLKIARVKPSIA